MHKEKQVEDFLEQRDRRAMVREQMEQLPSQYRMGKDFSQGRTQLRAPCFLVIRERPQAYFSEGNSLARTRCIRQKTVSLHQEDGPAR